MAEDVGTRAWVASDAFKTAEAEVDLLAQTTALLPHSYAASDAGAGVGIALTLEQSTLIVGVSGSGKSSLLQAMMVGAHRFHTYFIFYLPRPLRLTLASDPLAVIPPKHKLWTDHNALPSLDSALALLSLYPTQQLLDSICACFNALHQRVIGLLMPALVWQPADLRVRFVLDTRMTYPIQDDQDPLSAGECETLYYVILMHLIRHSCQNQAGDVEYPWSEYVPTLAAGDFASVTVLLEEPMQQLEMSRRKAVWFALLHSTQVDLTNLRQGMRFVITTNALDLAQHSCFDSFIQLFHIGSKRLPTAPPRSATWSAHWPRRFRELPVDVYEREHYLLPLRRDFMVSCAQVAAALVAPTPKMYVEGEHDLPVYGAIFQGLFDVRSTGGTRTLLPFMEGQQQLREQLKKQKLFADELFASGPVGIVDLDQRQLSEVEFLRSQQQVYSLTVSSLECLLVCPELLWALYGTGEPDCPAHREPTDLVDPAAMTAFLACDRMQRWTKRLAQALAKSLPNLQQKFENNSFLFDLKQLSQRYQGDVLRGTVGRLLLADWWFWKWWSPRRFAPGMIPAAADYFTILSCFRGHSWADRQEDHSVDAAAGVKQKVMTDFWEIWTPGLPMPERMSRPLQTHISEVVHLFQRNTAAWRLAQLHGWLLQRDTYQGSPSLPRTFQPKSGVDHHNGCGYLALTVSQFDKLVGEREPSRMAPNAFALSFKRTTCDNEWAVTNRERHFQDRTHAEQFKSNLPVWNLPLHWASWISPVPASAVLLPHLSIPSLHYAVLLHYIDRSIAQLLKKEVQKDSSWCISATELLTLLQLLSARDAAVGASCLPYRLLMERQHGKGTQALQRAHLRSQSDDSELGQAENASPPLLWALLQLLLKHLQVVGQARTVCPQEFITFGCHLLYLTCRILPRPFSFWMMEEIMLLSVHCAEELFFQALTSMSYLLCDWPLGAFDWAPFMQHDPSFRAYCFMQTKWFELCKKSPMPRSHSTVPLHQAELRPCLTAFLCGTLAHLVNGYVTNAAPVVHQDSLHDAFNVSHGQRYRGKRYLSCWLDRHQGSSRIRKLASVWQAIRRLLMLPARAATNPTPPRDSTLGVLLFDRVNIAAEGQPASYLPLAAVVCRLLEAGEKYDRAAAAFLIVAPKDEWKGSRIDVVTTWAKFIKLLSDELTRINWVQHEHGTEIHNGLINTLNETAGNALRTLAIPRPVGARVDSQEVVLLQRACKYLARYVPWTSPAYALAQTLVRQLNPAMVDSLCRLVPAASSMLPDPQGYNRHLVQHVCDLGWQLHQWFKLAKQPHTQSNLNIMAMCHQPCVDFTEAAVNAGFPCPGWWWLTGGVRPPKLDHGPSPILLPLNPELVRQQNLIHIVKAATPSNGHG